MSNTVFVGNLPYSIEIADLRNFFAEVGDVTDAKIITDFHTGRSKGYGFVTYVERAHAQEAVEKLDNKEFSGRSIRVSFAKNRERQNSNHRDNDRY